MKNSRKILVTGGAGYIGSHTVVELIRHGYEPVIIDNFCNAQSGSVLGIQAITDYPVTLYRADCRDEERLRWILRKEGPMAGVIHFAALKSVAESGREPLRYYQNNLGALHAVLALMEQEGIPRLVFSSSATVYGQADALPVYEDTPWKEAASVYGKTKQLGETIINEVMANRSDQQAICLRYFNPVGAHPSGLIGEWPQSRPENLVPYLTQAAAGLRDPLTVFGNDYNTPDGTAIRDYIHVMDLANAHVKALDYMLAADQRAGNTEVFNIGTGRGNSVLELIRTFEKVNGVQVPHHIGPRRDGDIEQIYANCDRARDVLGWSATRSLGAALKDAWQWQCGLQSAQLRTAS
ncbi:MAG: UDP-glucose 4-epimerase GalE [Bacteroidota bacterium]